MKRYTPQFPSNRKIEALSPLERGRGCVLTCLLLLLLFQSSCEKDITVDLPPPESKIVVEGTIESNGTPYLYLSKNAPYFAPVDPTSLNEYIVHDAKVTVSDGAQTDTLREIVLSGRKTGYYATFNMKGVAGKYYQLTIEAAGKKLWATAKIPPLVPLDSAWFLAESEGDSLGRITAHLSDPDSIGNYYRVMTQRTNKKYYTKNPLGIDSPPDYVPSFSSNFEDRIFNGKSFDVRISRGQALNSTADYDSNRERGRFKKGDTISIKWMSISKETYDFWKTVEVTVNNSGNPFAAPVTIKSNIKGDGLGTWAGYGITYRTVVAK